MWGLRIMKERKTNMHKIAFRAWDKLNKKMITPVFEYTPSENIYTTYNDFVNKWIYGLDNKNIVLMQFIGIQDGNGVEIYEEDILKYVRTDIEIDTFWMVKFRSGGLFVAYPAWFDTTERIWKCSTQVHFVFNENKIDFIVFGHTYDDVFGNK